MSLTIGTYRRWLKESINPNYYDQLYQSQLFMSGDRETVLGLMKGGRGAMGSGKVHGSSELPDYPDREPEVAQIGIMNHALVNARIMVQGLNLTPEIQFNHPDPIVREINRAYILDLMKRGNWAGQFAIGTLELEANGFCAYELGIQEGIVQLTHAPNLDIVFDWAYKTPRDWRFVAHRKRCVPEEIGERYPFLTKRELDDLTKMGTLPDLSRGLDAQVAPREQIKEWSLWSKDHHLVFLGSMFGRDSIVLEIGEDGEYQRVPRRGDIDNALPGVNPYGVIPYVIQVDSWSPSVAYPMSKMMTTLTPALMLNEVERCMTSVMRNGRPIVNVDATKLEDPQLAEDIRNARTWEDLNRTVILGNGDMREIVQRISAEDLPSALLQMRDILKTELNAATGVGDMQRGQALGGERRTRYEVQQLADQSGVQARHFKRTFADMLEDVIQRARTIGAQYDTLYRELPLEGMEAINTRDFPLAPFLSEFMPVSVTTESLNFMSDGERQQQALLMLNAFLMPMVTAGVFNPAAVANYVGRSFGIPDAMSMFGASASSSVPMTGPDMVEQDGSAVMAPAT